MRETKTVQVYPSDEIVNATIEVYGCFGWEVIGNQRFQEFEGTTQDYDGSVTRHFSTFNKITFSREKSSPWYEKVAQLEREYNNAQEEIERYESYKPVAREVKPSGVAAYWLGLFLFISYIVPGIIYVIVRRALQAKYDKQYEEEYSKYWATYGPKIEELKQKRVDLLAYSQAHIAGKA